MSTPDTGLRVSGLCIRGPEGQHLVDELSFSIAPGERVGLIGESGSGKSLTALAIIGLLPEALTASGSICWGETEVVGARERSLNALRGRAAAIVFQEPLTALDPLMRLGRQLAEPLRRRAKVDGTKLSGAGLDRALLASLDEVRLPDPERILRAYPHEISGGQRQRVALAIALAGRPALLIADEPTTALDETIQSEILDLLDSLVHGRDMALLFISHDLAVVSRIATRAVVLRAGVAVESGTVRDLLTAPQHPYTQELIASARQLDRALDWGNTA
jgi:peptide/nickel transport system ATP-binding protein